MSELGLPKIRYVPFKGGRLAYREKGNGTVLFLLHGMNGSSRSWINSFKSLSGLFRLIAWDAPSFGASDVFGDTISDYKNAAKELIHSLNVKNIILIGHSMGGLVATQIASDQSVSVAGLILSSSHLGFAYPKGKSLMPRYTNQIKQLYYNRSNVKHAFKRTKKSSTVNTVKIEKDITEILPTKSGDSRIESIRDGGRMSQETDNRPICKNIHCPIMILSGEHDQIITPKMHAEVLVAFPKAQQVEFKKIGHASYNECPSLFNKQVKEFSQKVSALCPATETKQIIN